jgi:hypothetical protein
MVDFSARASYRGTAELPNSTLPNRRPASKPGETAGIPDMATRASLRPGGRRQEVGTAPSPRQTNSAAPAKQADGWSIFSKKDTGARTPAPATAATSTAPASEAKEPALAAPVTRAEADALVVKALKDALTAAGVNFEALGLEAHEDVVTYPGGSYINRYISVTTKSGHMEGLMTDLVAINPRVAVLDIQRMMGTIA